jgi:hypothetical protein
MAYNLGSVGTGYSLGYVGAYTGAAETYVLTDHVGPLAGGEEHPNSIMSGNKFATTGPVYFDITGGDANIANPSWASINTAQLWLTDINDISAFNPVAVGSVTYTVTYRVSEGGATGTFQRTVNVTEDGPALLPVVRGIGRKIGLRSSASVSLRSSINSSIH